MLNPMLKLIALTLKYKLKKAARARQPLLEKEKKMKKLTVVSDNC